MPISLASATYLRRQLHSRCVYRDDGNIVPVILDSWQGVHIFMALVVLS